MHRRRRLHRAVGGAAREGRRPLPRRRRARGGDRRRSAPAAATAGSRASLTHGIANGLRRFAGEMETLERLGARTSTGMRADLDAPRHRLRARARPASCWSSLEPDRTSGSRRRPSCCAASATTSSCSTPRRCAPRSPRRPTTARCGTARAPRACDPGRLAGGLRAPRSRAGVRIHEHTRGDALRGPRRTRRPSSRRAGACARGAVLLATSAYPPLAPRAAPLRRARSTTTCS